MLTWGASFSRRFSSSDFLRDCSTWPLSRPWAQAGAGAAAAIARKSAARHGARARIGRGVMAIVRDSHWRNKNLESQERPFLSLHPRAVKEHRPPQPGAFPGGPRDVGTGSGRATA